MFPCFVWSLRKSAGIVLTTGFFGCIIFVWVLDMYDWYNPLGRSSCFRIPGPFVYYLLFVCCRGCTTGTVGCICCYGYHASLALLWDSLMFCMNRVLLILLKALFVDLVAVLISDGIFLMCVLMNSSIAAIRMAMVITI